MIEKSINDEISNRQVYTLIENEKELSQILQNIVFCQLGNFAASMREFNVESLYAIEMISKQACKHNLLSEDINTLMATIDPKYQKKSPEIPASVQRGVPDWLKNFSAPSKRNPQKTLSLLLNPKS